MFDHVFIIDINNATYIVITSHIGMFDAGQHDLLPSFTSGASEQQQHRPAKALEVVVAMNVGLVVECNATKDLHAHDSVDEEDQGDEDGYPGQGLEGLEEGPEQGPDALVLVKELDQPRYTEQPQEPDGSITVGLK